MTARGGRTALVAAALTLCSAVIAPATAAETDLETRVVTLRHQPVGDAVSLIVPLLSERGGVELRPGGSTLVIRDVPESLARILPLLADFDRPATAIRVEIRIVSAGGREAPASAAGELPEELLERLRELLRYRNYRLLAGDAIDTLEGGAVRHRLGAGYRVEFRLGRLTDDRRIRLEGFRIFRGNEEETEPLIHTNISLRVDKPMVLGLARTESSESALMVVLECGRAAEPED